jgi:hypothetical protein
LCLSSSLFYTLSLPLSVLLPPPPPPPHPPLSLSFPLTLTHTNTNTRTCPAGTLDDTGFWARDLTFGFWVFDFGVWGVRCGGWGVGWGVWGVEGGVWNLQCGVGIPFPRAPWGFPGRGWATRWTTRLFLKVNLPRGS